MSTVIELTVADNEHEDIAIVWHAHQSYSGLGALGIWARRSRHGVAVRSVPGGNKTNRTIPRSSLSTVFYPNMALKILSNSWTPFVVTFLTRPRRILFLDLLIRTRIRLEMKKI